MSAEMDFYKSSEFPAYQKAVPGKTIKQYYTLFLFNQGIKPFWLYVSQDLKGTTNDQKVVKSIRDLLLQAFAPGYIQEKIVSDRVYGEAVLVTFFPDWGEWYQSYRILTDLEGWYKDSIAMLNSIADPAGKKAYIAEVKRLLRQYGPEDVETGISREVVAEWTALFMGEEIQAAQAAAFELTQIKNKKLFGFLLLGGFGVFAASKLLKKGK